MHRCSHAHDFVFVCLPCRYATSMSPPVAQQILSALRIISGEDGTTRGRDRIRTLAANSAYFRRAAQKMGLIVYGAQLGQQKRGGGVVRSKALVVMVVVVMAVVIWFLFT